MNKVKYNSYNRNGYSLVELILAMALFSLFAAAIIFLVLGSFGSNQRSAKMTDAKSYLEETNEAIRSIGYEAFNKLEAGNYALSFNASDNKWTLEDILHADYDPDGDGPFIKRDILIEDVERDVNGDMVEGETNDPYTRKVTTILEWDIGAGQTTSLSSELFITDWEGSEWIQTDWSDGDGQSTWVDEEMYESGDNNLDIASTPGQITLAEIDTDYTYNWDFSNDTDYDLSDSDLIEVTSGVAQLKSESEMIESQNQEFEDGAGGTGSDPDYWGNPGGSGTWYTTGGYPSGTGRYVSLELPRRKSGLLNGFWQHDTLTTDEDDPDSVTLTFKWRADQYDVPGGSSATMTAYANIDTSGGTPNIANAIWTQAITSVSAGWQTATIDVTSDMYSADDYYLKLALEVDYNGGAWDGPFEVAFDNVDLEWSKDGYTTEKPYVENIDSWEPDALGMITGFTETAIKDTGTEIYYQFSNDDGGTWYYYDASSEEWVSTSDPDEANAEADVNDYIKYFSVDNSSQIKFRAYLESDGGTHQVQLDGIEFTYNPDTVTMEANEITVTETWQTFDLTNEYDADGPVIVATNKPDATNDSPHSIRIRNITSTTFDAKLNYPDDNYTPTNSTASEIVHYLAVEDGYWILNNTNNTRIEAHRYDTTTIGRKGRWRADSKTYELDYSANPLILHQIMSEADARWINTWVSRDGSPANPPNTTGFQIGLNAAEVSNVYPRTTDATIGYIVIDNNGADDVDGNNFNTSITAKNIRGYGTCNSFGSYFTTPLIIASQQGMSGGDGGWIQKCGTNPRQARFYIEEDQYTDAERNHTTERSAFIAFENSFSVYGKAVTDNYETTGYLISSAFEASRNFNIVDWDADSECDDCEVLVQIRTATDQASLTSAAWEDFTVSDFLTYDDHDLDTWAQYRVELTGDGTNTPTFREINIDYY